jgi:hypothetical protein
MKNVTVEEGAPATFSTQVTAKQKPTIQWYREGALIPQSSDFKVEPVVHETLFFFLFFFCYPNSKCFLICVDDVRRKNCYPSDCGDLRRG